MNSHNEVQSLYYDFFFPNEKMKSAHKESNELSSCQVDRSSRSNQVDHQT